MDGGREGETDGGMEGALAAVWREDELNSLLCNLISRQIPASCRWLIAC